MLFWQQASSPSRSLFITTCSRSSRMGLALLIVDLEGAGAAHRRCALLKTRRALLGKDLRPHLRRGRGDRHPHGVSIWNQLVALLSHRRRRQSARRLGKEGMFAFFLESTTLGLFLYGAKKLGGTRAPRGRDPAVARIVALRLLHHRDQRIDATPGRATASPPMGTAAGSSPDFWAFVLNRWALWEYLWHNMCAAVVTGFFVVAAIAAY